MTGLENGIEHRITSQSCVASLLINAIGMITAVAQCLSEGC